MVKGRTNWVRLDVETAGVASVKLFDFLRNNIKGQDDAIKDLSDAVEIREASFQEDDKPIYRGLLMGPSGVGKTLVAEMLAEFWFGSRVRFTRIPCESYSEPHAISRLVGSPPGYVGYFNPEGGGGGTAPILAQENIDKWAIEASESKEPSSSPLKDTMETVRNVEKMLFRLLAKRFLTDPKEVTLSETNDIDKALAYLTEQRLKLLDKLEGLRTKSSGTAVKNPLSILLFDEVEKASPTLHNIILNVLDKAALPLANGLITKFNNSVILVTSNANSRTIADLISKKPKLGFQDLGSSRSPESLGRQIYEKSMNAASMLFTPEFLARFDRISVFHPLSEAVLSEIFDLELCKFEELYLRPLLVFLKIDESAKKFIISEATDKPQNGARLLKQKIHKYLRRQLGRLKNRNELDVGDTVHVLLGPDNRTLEFYREPPVIIGSPKKLDN